jgi:hypothetical protein
MGRYIDQLSQSYKMCALPGICMGVTPTQSRDASRVNRTRKKTELK